jgi:hypothetical protein
MSNEAPHDPGAGYLSANAVGFSGRDGRFVLQPLSPREIQARVRAGASPEVVSSETGWPLDKVARYAEPPLGERAYIAEQASGVEISRSRGGSTLHQSVCTRLSVDTESEAVTWDSYRTEDGRWVVTAFHDGGSVGTWLFEIVGRTVHPQDASARALMGAGPTEVPQETAQVAPAEVDDSVEAWETPEPSARPRLVSITSDPTAPASEASSERESEFSAPTAERPAEQQQTALIEEPASAPRRTKRSKGKKGRASVPSWDEILFGATRDSE